MDRPQTGQPRDPGAAQLAVRHHGPRASSSALAGPGPTRIRGGDDLLGWFHVVTHGAHAALVLCQLLPHRRTALLELGARGMTGASDFRHLAEP